jgi:hypothetical protein
MDFSAELIDCAGIAEASPDGAGLVDRPVTGEDWLEEQGEFYIWAWTSAKK